MLVLHTFEETDSSSEQCVRLLQRAKEAGDWELCKELARFLMALDETGDSLRDAMQRINISPQDTNGQVAEGMTYLHAPASMKRRSPLQTAFSREGSSAGSSVESHSPASLASQASQQAHGLGLDVTGDYFSLEPP